MGLEEERQATRKGTSSQIGCDTHVLHCDAGGGGGVAKGKGGVGGRVHLQQRLFSLNDRNVRGDDLTHTHTHSNLKSLI